MEEDESREPEAPHDHLVNGLHVQDSKNKDELVEDEVPELVFQVLDRPEAELEGSAHQLHSIQYSLSLKGQQEYSTWKDKFI